MAINDTKTQPESVSSVLKVFGILQALGDKKELGISELSQHVMMSTSTVYRFLQTMKTLGYVTQEEDSEKYSLTIKLFELGAKSLQNVDLIRYADIQMRKLSKKTKETVHLGALDEDSIIYLHKIDSVYNLRMHSRIGRRNPLHTTAIGKVLLAWLPLEEQQKILEKIDFTISTPNTLDSMQKLLPQLKHVAELGYAEDKEEQEMGLYCIGAPIFDRFGHVIAGLSISYPMIRFDEENKNGIISILHDATRQISAQMGFHDYPF